MLNHCFQKMIQSDIQIKMLLSTSMFLEKMKNNLIDN